MNMDITIWNISLSTCGDCGVDEGTFHDPRCDQARCNRCGGQYLSCKCGPLRRQVPYIEYPQHCVRCGCAWPEHFYVSNAEWRATIQKDQRNTIICHPCFEQIRRLLGLPPCPWDPPKPRPLSAAHALAEMRGCSLDEATDLLEAIGCKYQMSTTQEPS